jgi:hypothetical protein
VSAQSWIVLVLGSSVLAAVLGAYATSVWQREERFRDRMVEAAVDFLKQVATVQSTVVDTATTVLSDAAQEASLDGAGDQIRLQATSLWPSVPILMVVFPTQEVADAARALIQQIEDTPTALAAAVDRTRPLAHQRLKEHLERLDRLHTEYAITVNTAIRGHAFKDRFAPRRRGHP